VKQPGGIAASPASGRLGAQGIHQVQADLGAPQGSFQKAEHLRSRSLSSGLSRVPFSSASVPGATEISIVLLVWGKLVTACF